jgi:hypothetical protein
MDFRIADTFTDSLARLNGQEQKVAKTSAFDLQLDPSAPGLQFHRIDRSKDPNFWSLRVNRDLRIVVHRTAASILLCFAGADHSPTAHRLTKRLCNADQQLGRVLKRSRCEDCEPLRTWKQDGPICEVRDREELVINPH